jgi:hypothetical protein
MGLHEKRESSGNFLLVKHHSLVLESKEPKEGYEEIHPQNPQDKKEDGTFGTVTKYIKRFASVDGMVKRIEWYDSGDKYEDRFMSVRIHITDNGEYFQLELPFNSRPYDSFTKLMENIDFTKPVEFSVWYDKRQDKTAFAVRQAGIPVKWKYTRDDMGDCPVPTQNTLGKWNFDTQKEWLHSRLINVVIPQVDALNAFDEPQDEYDEERAAIQEYSGDEGTGHEPESSSFVPAMSPLKRAILNENEKKANPTYKNAPIEPPEMVERMAKTRNEPI